MIQLVWRNTNYTTVWWLLEHLARNLASVISHAIHIRFTESLGVRHGIPRGSTCVSVLRLPVAHLLLSVSWWFLSFLKLIHCQIIKQTFCWNTLQETKKEKLFSILRKLLTWNLYLRHRPCQWSLSARPLDSMTAESLLAKIKKYH